MNADWVSSLDAYLPDGKHIVSMKPSLTNGEYSINLELMVEPDTFNTEINLTRLQDVVRMNFSLQHMEQFAIGTFYRGKRYQYTQDDFKFMFQVTNHWLPGKHHVVLKVSSKDINLVYAAVQAARNYSLIARSSSMEQLSGRYG